MTLPNFIIIGAMRAGTTSLWKYFSDHPDVFMTPVKETQYFAYGDPATAWWEQVRPFPAKTLEEYEALFADAGDEIAVGEASPLYLESVQAPLRIKETLPAVKLIASLRDPAERAYSEWKKLALHMPNSPAARRFDASARYVRMGSYHRMLERYYDVFPKDQIEIVITEDLERRPHETMAELYAFVGVEASHRAPMAKHNEGKVPRSRRLHEGLVHPRVRKLVTRAPTWTRRLYHGAFFANLKPMPPMPAELRRRLQDIYRDDILRLQDLIDRDLSRWLA